MVRTEWVILTVIAALLVLLVWASIEGEKEWDRFAKVHECRVVAKVRGDTFNTVSVDSKGNPVVGVSTTPDKTGWICNDGITYYR